MAKNCINPQCEKEIPSNATFCSFCGTQQVETESLSEEEKLRKGMTEMQGTIQLLKKALSDAQQNNDSSVEKQQVVENLQKQLDVVQNKNKTIQNLPNEPLPPEDDKPNHSPVLFVGLALLFLLVILVGYFAFYRPYATDRDAPRFYSIASNTFLRSTQEAGVDYNKLGAVPYGSELITYNNGSEWSEVKWKDSEVGSSIKGYISSDYILPYKDFKILNSIWGDNESKETIKTTKCRIALLNYFKEKGYSGSWQVFSKSKDMKPNTTYYGRIVNSNSKFSDFAVIIKNISTGERKCLLFTFDDDETAHLIYEENAPSSGDIANVYYSSYSGYNILYR